MDPEFGTGALKITPGHDPNDFEIGRKHGREIVVIGEDGRMTDAAPERYRGMDADEALAAVVADLRAEGLISLAAVRPRRAALAPLGKRVEPLISLQWFCDMDRLARPAIDVVRDGTIRFHPEKPWTGVYLNWLEEHPALVHLAPALVGPPAARLVSRRRDVCGREPDGDGWARDPDVLDTWFSSGSGRSPRSAGHGGPLSCARSTRRT